MKKAILSAELVSPHFLGYNKFGGSCYRDKYGRDYFRPEQQADHTLEIPWNGCEIGNEYPVSQNNPIALACLYGGPIGDDYEYKFSPSLFDCFEKGSFGINIVVPVPGGGTTALLVSLDFLEPEEDYADEDTQSTEPDEDAHLATAIVDTIGRYYETFDIPYWQHADGSDFFFWGLDQIPEIDDIPTFKVLGTLFCLNPGDWSDVEW